MRARFQEESLTPYELKRKVKVSVPYPVRRFLDTKTKTYYRIVFWYKRYLVFRRYAGADNNIFNDKRFYCIGGHYRTIKAAKERMIKCRDGIK